MMHILLVNDDGIAAPGIWALYDALAGEHDVTVCAPHEQCSGLSHAITIRTPLRARRYGRGGARAYEVFGTPADCTLLGLGALAPGPVDMVISGINDGYNSAADVHYSGTIGAACEACLEGVPALAVSTRGGNVKLETAVRLAREMLDRVARGCVPGVFFNLNVPPDPVKGLINAPLGVRAGAVDYLLTGGDAADGEYRMAPAGYCSGAGGDIDALGAGYATWTRLGCDWTRGE